MNAADLESTNAHIFTDPVVLMNDIVADFELCIALDPFGIIYAFGHLAGFTLLLREHFAFGDHRQMNRRQFKAGTQIALKERRLFNAVIIEYPADAFHPLLAAGQHNHLHARFMPTLHLRFQHIHLAVEILHPPADKAENILRLDVRNLTQEDRHEQTLERTAVHNHIVVYREVQIRQIFAVL
ncbi:hypothetical protein D3C73_1210130 [compost metagenome]